MSPERSDRHGMTDSFLFPDPFVRTRVRRADNRMAARHRVPEASEATMAPMPWESRSMSAGDADPSSSSPAACSVSCPSRRYRYGTLYWSAVLPASRPRAPSPRLAGNKADNWYLRQCPKVLNLPFKPGIRRADRDNTIDVYIGDECMDVLRDGAWQQFFTEKPEEFTREERREWLSGMTGVALGSDAFFPFGDNIERAHKSGVEFIAQPGGSIRDDNVIETCDKYGIAMAFTGIRLFHH